MVQIRNVIASRVNVSSCESYRRHARFHYSVHIPQERVGIICYSILLILVLLLIKFWLCNLFHLLKSVSLKRREAYNSKAFALSVLAV